MGYVLFYIFAKSFEEGDEAFAPEVFLGEVFADFDCCFFAAVVEAFDVQEVLPLGRSGGFEGFEFGVDDVDRLLLIVNLAVPLFEGLDDLDDSRSGRLRQREEGGFGGFWLLVFDVGIDLLEDLDFLGVGEGVVVFA